MLLLASGIALAGDDPPKSKAGAKDEAKTAKKADGGSAAKTAKPQSKTDPAKQAAQQMMDQLKAMAAKAPPQFKKGEAGEMLNAILSGSRMGAGDGWFKASQTRFGYEWLTRNFDSNKDGGVTKEEWTGPSELFDRLDRDRNGVVKRDDFDWTDSSAYLRSLGQATGVFYKIDPSSNGRISKKEWESFFARAAKGKEYLTPEDIRDSLFAAAPAAPANAKREMGPTPAILMKGFLAGELGSPFEGPKIGDVAPDFTLKFHNSDETLNFNRFRGKRPAVLVFGSFT